MAKEARFGGLTLFDLTPVYVITFEDGWSTKDLAAVQRAMLARGAPRVAFISEVLNIRPAGAVERKALADSLKALKSELDARAIVSIVVTDSSIMRGVIRAVTWVYASPYPLVTASSMDEAREVLREHLAGAGLTLDHDTWVEIGALARRRAKAVAAR